MQRNKSPSGGGPRDAKAGLGAPVWAGVILLSMKYGKPVAAGDYRGNPWPPRVRRR